MRKQIKQLAKEIRLYIETIESEAGVKYEAPALMVEVSRDGVDESGALYVALTLTLKEKEKAGPAFVSITRAYSSPAPFAWSALTERGAGAAGLEIVDEGVGAAGALQREGGGAISEALRALLDHIAASPLEIVAGAVSVTIGTY